MSKRDRKKKRTMKRAEARNMTEITKASENSKKPVKGGMIVYGVGAHLKDMLSWHKDLAGRIAMVIDKDEAKIGTKVYGLECKVESPKILKDLPEGTQIAVSALRYYGEIVKELRILNSGLICPDIDQAYFSIRQAEARGMLVYGAGAHLMDMLAWHPDLKGKIARIFDKDEKRRGQKALGTDKIIECPEALKHLAPGTKIAISAIRYYEEIVKEIYELNSGLVCLDIDVAYAAMPISKTTPIKPAVSKSVPAKPVMAKSETPAIAPKTLVKVRNELSVLQKHRLNGKAAAERWRRKFLIECANMRKVFWGTKGIRANYLIQEFRQFIGKEDFFIDDDVNLRGMSKAGVPICVPEVLKDIQGSFKIIVLSCDYAKIKERLMDYGYIENVDFVEGRHLLGEDENGYIDVPCVDKTKTGMIVYGEGAHLADMLKWHPELAWTISRVIDKDKKKTGSVVKNIGVTIEPIEVLRDLPIGTEVAISAIKYFNEIKKDVHELQPGLICRSIDEVWREYV